MGKQEIISEALKLGEEDRLELIEALSESFPADYEPEMRPELRAELERRHQDAVDHPNEGATWEEVSARMKAGKRRPGA